MKALKVRVPGSKSHTHRAFICAALAEGESFIKDPLISDDTLYTLRALEAMGVEVKKREDGLSILGKSGKLTAPSKPIYLGNSGTSMRFLMAISCLALGKTVLDGSKRLRERPVGPLTSALKLWDAKVEDRNGFPPVEVLGGMVEGGETEVDAGLSSQFLSALLLLGPYTQLGGRIKVVGHAVSRPYVDITLEVMGAFGVPVKRDGKEFAVDRGNYRGTIYRIPPDPSSATYAFLAGILSGKEVKVLGLNLKGSHPDLGFLKVIEKMGAEVKAEPDGVSVRGGEGIRGVEVDMSDMPDSVPTLAVLAAFSEGETVIKGIEHLRIKESDRIEAIKNGLMSMGIEVEVSKNSMKIIGGSPKPSLIDPHGDHRIAMAFSLASLRVPGIKVKNPGCVTKSFPDFWQFLKKLRGTR